MPKHLGLNLTLCMHRRKGFKKNLKVMFFHRYSKDTVLHYCLGKSK